MNDFWNLMNNWNQIIPPSRPSIAQLDALRLLASNIDKKSNVAVLGSTAEYRDILYELSFTNIYVFDNNKFFYKKTSDYRVYTNEEIYIDGDWIDTIAMYPNTFSLIVSDLTSGNIPYEWRKKFYLDIENSLMRGGVFFDKILTHENNFLNIEELISKYEKLPINLVTINSFSCEFLFCSELLLENEIVNTNKFYSKIEALSENKRINKFIELSKSITPPDFVWYYGKNWSVLKEDYCVNLLLLFEIEDDSKSPYYHFVKIFALKK